MSCRLACAHTVGRQASDALSHATAPRLSDGQRPAAGPAGAGLGWQSEQLPLHWQQHEQSHSGLEFPAGRAAECSPSGGLSAPQQLYCAEQCWKQGWAAQCPAAMTARQRQDGRPLRRPLHPPQLSAPRSRDVHCPDRWPATVLAGRLRNRRHCWRDRSLPRRATRLL